MTEDHTMRPECAAQFAELRAGKEQAEQTRMEVRQDIKDLHAKMDAGFQQGLEAISTLKERSRTWGVIGGLFSSVAISVVAGIILAVVLI